MKSGRKPKGFAAKYGVTLITMNAFLRAVKLSKGSGKIGDRIKLAFERHGQPMPPGASVIPHCLANHDFIVEKGRGHRSRTVEKIRRDEPKSISEPPPYTGDVSRDDFLSSFQWRRLRMQVMRHYGPKCMCCGATPDNGAVMNVDHIKPRKTHPHLALDFGNMQVLCHECNHGKGNWDTTDWRPKEDEVSPEVQQFIRSIAKGTS